MKGDCQRADIFGTEFHWRDDQIDETMYFKCIISGAPPVPEDVDDWLDQVINACREVTGYSLVERGCAPGGFFADRPNVSDTTICGRTFVRVTWRRGQDI